MHQAGISLYFIIPPIFHEYLRKYRYVRRQYAISFGAIINLREKDYLEDLGVGGRIILKLMFKKSI